MFIDIDNLLSWPASQLRSPVLGGEVPDDPESAFSAW